MKGKKRSFPKDLKVNFTSSDQEQESNKNKIHCSRLCIEKKKYRVTKQEYIDSPICSHLKNNNKT